MKEIVESINRGVRYLDLEEKANNYFGFEEIFPTILMFDCLNEIKTPESDRIKKRISANLLKEKSDYWSFNYWRRNSKRAVEEPYPDDLDDTCCAVGSLLRFNSDLIDGNTLALIVNLLILCEEAEGGPYRTWIIPKEKAKNWDDVDVAVNSNIAYFLKLEGVKLKNVNNFIETAIEKNKISSPFYKGELPVIYFISRFYRGKFKKVLKEKLVKAAKTSSSSLDLALIISSLIRLGFSKLVKNSWVQTLIKNQQKDGLWLGEDFYFYVDKIKKSEFIGNNSMSTAFVMESLSLYLKNNFQKESDSDQQKEYVKRIMKKFGKLWEQYPAEIKNLIVSSAEKILNRDSLATIILTPALIVNSLDKKYKKQIPDELIIQLCLVNLLGWCAYTTYDHMIDGDLPIEFLPVANMVCREMDILFNNLDIKKSTGFFDLYRKIMQKTEMANFVELKKCRFDPKQEKIDIKEFDFKIFSDRSMGHALSSVAIWCFLGYSANSDEVKNLLAFFENFIMARQMNDDAHDWQKDWDRGQLNTANYRLIKRLKEEKQEELLETKNRKKLDVYFWQNVIPDYCQEIINKADEAVNLVESLSCIENKKVLVAMNNKNKEVALSAIKERNKTLEFIKTYYK